ncbi:MAG: N-acetyltransferase family protein [Burkholderiaceae bacterium]
MEPENTVAQRPDADALDQWQSPDGTNFVIRPLRADEAEQELDFIRSLSQQTRYERTFSHRGMLGPGELNKLVHFDVHHEVALVAAVQGAAPATFAAVARLKKSSGGQFEFAIVVRDAWQRHGIGARLLHKLLEVARRAGVPRVIGFTFATNQAMKGLARKAGFKVRSDPEDASLSLLEIDL